MSGRWLPLRVCNGTSLRALALAAFLAVTACSGSGPTDHGPSLQARLQTALDRALSDYGGKGVSAAVVLHGDLAWRGTAHAEGSAPVASDDLFLIASITKMFTAVVTLQLIDEGVLHFDDQLHQFLPTYQYLDSTITVRQLLDHTAGVFDFSGNHPSYNAMMDEDRYKCWTPEETVTRLLLEPHNPPGAAWRYSTGNYVVLGMVIQAVTGRPVSEEFRTRIYEPLGLQHTFLDCADTIAGAFANVWIDLTGDGVPEENPVAPLGRQSMSSTGFTGGGMISSAGDIARFTDALFGRRVLLSPAMLEEMLDFNTDLPADFGWLGYGKGAGIFRLSMVNGAHAYGHGGWMAVVLSATAYLPDYDASITIMSNSLNWPFWEGVMNALATVVTEGVGPAAPSPPAPSPRAQRAGRNPARSP